MESYKDSSSVKFQLSKIPYFGVLVRYKCLSCCGCENHVKHFRKNYLFWGSYIVATFVAGVKTALTSEGRWVNKEPQESQIPQGFSMWEK